MKITNRYYRFLVILPIFAVLAFRFLQVYRQPPSRVQAVGDLEITYLAVPLSGPIFTVTNMLPGDCQQRTVSAVNNGPANAKLAVRSDQEQDPDQLASQLSMRIHSGATDLYGGTSLSGPRTVADFFSDSHLGPDGLYLATLAPSATQDFHFEVCFDPAAGNEYQNTQVIFDLVFGEILSEFDLPAECALLEGIITAKIEGDAGNNTINGTSASEYIIGYGGNDTIRAGGGNDCIDAGEGDDDVDAGSGEDIIIGGPGNDTLDGHSDDDLIYGGDGDDFLEGKHGRDLIYAGIGNDRVEAGSDPDLIFGGPGNDTLSGGSGDDEIYGEGDDDTLNGNSGNDLLDGGPGTNVINGNSGVDTCTNGPTFTSCP